MYVDLKPILRRAAPRALCAALKNPRGERIGRFGLTESGGHRSHRWEWLDGPWPDQIFYMEPDIDEPSPSEALSRAYSIPPSPWCESARSPSRLNDGGGRCYEVLRVDGPEVRRIARLRAHQDALVWTEEAAGGALELCPAWLAFRPCDPLPELDGRCWVQPLERPSRSAPVGHVAVPTSSQVARRWRRPAMLAAWPM